MNPFNLRFKDIIFISYLFIPNTMDKAVKKRVNHIAYMYLFVHSELFLKGFCW